MYRQSSIEKTFYHFNFLKDIKFHGIYLNSIDKYIAHYPFIKKPHFHDFYTILLFTKGRGRIKVCNDSFDIHSQAIFLIAPDQMHSFEEFENIEGIVFHFCQDFYVEEFSFMRLLNLFSYTNSSDEEYFNPCLKLTEMEISPAVDIINLIQTEYELPASGKSAVIIRSLLNIGLLRLTDLLEIKTGRLNKSDSSVIHKLSHFVESHFIQEHNIGFYSRAFDITEKQLNTICNRNFKCGLKKILRDRLMQESRRLLLTSELSVAEISYKLNFQDNSYFNKVFRQSTGLTPKRFREMHKKLLP